MKTDSTLTAKQRVALELLDRGLQMYFMKSYFAAIHLAGAAEELFGQYLLIWKEGKPAADDFHDSVAQLLGYQVSEIPQDLSRDLYRRIFHSRNRTKHLNAEGDHEISFDAAHEAEIVLGRALSNFYAVASILGLGPTRRMIRFDRERISD
jgi:hypothetical protein